MSNKAIGSAFEMMLAKILSESGFWVHRMTQNAAGQPFDIMAVKRDKAYAIDCKVCERDRFDLSRIEENQESAMDAWRNCGNEEAYFALSFSDTSVAMISYMALITERDFDGKSSINKRRCFEIGTHLRSWIQNEDNSF